MLTRMIDPLIVKGEPITITGAFTFTLT